jgi:hypothetical protein
MPSLTSLFFGNPAGIHGIADSPGPVGLSDESKLAPEGGVNWLVAGEVAGLLVGTLGLAAGATLPHAIVGFVRGWFPPAINPHVVDVIHDRFLVAGF